MKNGKNTEEQEEGVCCRLVVTFLCFVVSPLTSPFAL